MYNDETPALGSTKGKYLKTKADATKEAYTQIIFKYTV